MLTLSIAVFGPSLTANAVTVNPPRVNLQSNKKKAINQTQSFTRETTADARFAIPRLPRRRAPQDDTPRRQHAIKFPNLLVDVARPGREPIKVVHDDRPRERPRLQSPQDAAQSRSSVTTSRRRDARSLQYRVRVQTERVHHLSVVSLKRLEPVSGEIQRARRCRVVSQQSLLFTQAQYPKRQ
jgi:hypothetical protein